jgi:hypothetical protein
MSRRTHPQITAKHTREHVRAQRQRHIRRRFDRAKRDGTFDRLSLRPRFSTYPYWLRGLGDGDAVEEALYAYLLSRGNAPCEEVPAWSVKVHPHVLLYLPTNLRGAVSAGPLHGAAAVGQLAKGHAFWHNRCRCSSCAPQSQDGYRRRNKNRWQREIEDEVHDRAHNQEELLGRLHTSVREEVSYNGCWC